jgi:dTDP-4-amino-4,6-dideoxygalactose transaminase
MKKRIADLAILNGSPEFSELLHVGRPNIGQRESILRRLNDMLDRRWLTNNGPYVQEFEQKICELIGVRNCIVICNATIALEITIRALELKGEVIVPSFTFVATAHALQWQEITPVFCDIDPETHNLDPRMVQKMITPRTSGIIGVHVWGRPCAVEPLEEIAQRNGIKIMYDAAHAFGCSYKAKMIGNFGEAEVFSFHATKFLNTFEGGAIVTNNDDLAKKIRLMTNFGFAGYDNVIYLGTNGKMSEISAAMGLAGLESIEKFIEINFRNYQRYCTSLEKIPGIKIIRYDETEKNNYQYIILEVQDKTTGLNRDDLVEILRAENILARKYFFPGCHQMEPYRSFFPHAGLLLPNTENLTGRVMSLPNGTAIEPDDVNRICQIIEFSIQNHEEVRSRIH